MIVSDKILDIKDKINSIDYCIDNSEDINKSIEIDSSIMLSKLEAISKSIINNTSSLKEKYSLIKTQYGYQGDIEKAVNKRMSILISLLYKINDVKNKISANTQVKISQHVSDFIQNV